MAGCGDAFGSGGRSNSCYLVEAAGMLVALDFGASAPVALKRMKVDTARIDMVVLSHLHGDHFGGLPTLLLDGALAQRRSRPLAIIGPPGTRARLGALMEVLYPGMGATPLAIRLAGAGGGAGLHLPPRAAQFHHGGGAPPRRPPATALRLLNSDDYKLFVFQCLDENICSKIIVNGSMFVRDTAKMRDMTKNYIAGNFKGNDYVEIGKSLLDDDEDRSQAAVADGNFWTKGDSLKTYTFANAGYTYVGGNF